VPVGENALSNEQLLEIMGVLKGSDSVELKVTIPASGGRAAAASLGMDPLDAQLRAVVFFDTPELSLNAAGVIVRARRIQGKRDGTRNIRLVHVPAGHHETAETVPQIVQRRDFGHVGLVEHADRNQKNGFGERFHLPDQLRKQRRNTFRMAREDDAHAARSCQMGFIERLAEGRERQRSVRQLLAVDGTATVPGRHD